MSFDFLSIVGVRERIGVREGLKEEGANGR